MISTTYEINEKIDIYQPSIMIGFGPIKGYGVQNTEIIREFDYVFKGPI